MPRKLTEPQRGHIEAEVVRLHQEGQMAVRDIAALYRRSTTWVYGILAQHGAAVRDMALPWTAEDLDQLADCYRYGWDREAMAEELGRTVNACDLMARRLRRAARERGQQWPGEQAMNTKDATNAG